MPQTLTDHWKEYLGDDINSCMQKLHTIGNLTLVHNNPVLSNLSFQEKIQIMNNMNLMYLNNNIINAEKWGLEAINNRAGDLFTSALRLWPSCE